MDSTSRLKTFLAKCKAVHGDRYDYGEVDYQRSSIKVRIKCSQHGVFEQTPSDHIGGHGCAKCYHASERTWSEADDQYLRDHYVAKGAAFCVAGTGKSRPAVYSRAQMLGLRRLGEYVEPYKDIPNRLWSNLGKRAIEIGRDINITQDDIWQLYLKQDKKCALTGWDIVFRRIGETTASVDRIDSNRGYLKDNIQIVHKDVNRSKVNYPDQYFYKMCRAIHEHRKGDFDRLMPHSRWEEVDEANDTVRVYSKGGWPEIDVDSLFDDSPAIRPNSRVS